MDSSKRRCIYGAGFVGAGGRNRSRKNADWSVKSSHNLALRPPSGDEVLALLTRLTGDDPGQVNICGFRFADLHHSGYLSLVVCSAPRMFGFLSIIDKTPTGFELYGSDSLFLGGPEIADLAGDGNQQVIVDALFTNYEGAQHCMSAWPVIFAWTGSGYTDVSRNYKDYYQKRLDILKEQLRFPSSAKGMPGVASRMRRQPSFVLAPVAGTVMHYSLAGRDKVATVVATPTVSAVASPIATAAAVLDPGSFDCVPAEVGKIERFLGSGNAGIADAITWATSDDQYQREFACPVLEDIATPEAAAYLQILTHDTNKVVAGSAELSLQFMQKGRAIYTIERREIATPGESSPK